MIRRRYLSRIFITRLLAVLFGLAGLLQLLDLLDSASDVLSRGGMADLARYTGWRLPSLISQILPLAVLVGGMLTLWRLAMTLEMTALRAAGIPVRHVLRAMLPVCLLAAVLQAGLIGFVTPRTERALAEWWVRTDNRAGTAEAPRRVWLRAGGQVVGIDRVSPDGRDLQGLLLVPRAPDGLATARIQAERAIFTEGRWRLQAVRIAQPGSPSVTAQAERAWPEGPSPREIMEIAHPTEAQNIWKLARSLRGEEAVNRGPAFYQTRLHDAAARLLAPFLMLLLAAPVAFGMPRRGGQVLPPLLALGLGLGYLLMGGLLAALGEAGVVPSVLAVWSAPLLFAGIGGAILIRYEER